MTHPEHAADGAHDGTRDGAHEEAHDEPALTGFEQLLGATGDRHLDDAVPGAVFFAATPDGDASPRTIRPVSGGTHRAGPRRPVRVRARRGSGWAVSVRAVGATSAAAAVLLLASVGSGAVDLSGASSDSMLAVVAPGVASALGQLPGQGTDEGTGEQSAQAMTTWQRAEPSSSGADATSASPARPSSTAAAPTGSAAAADATVVAVEPTREPQVTKPASQTTQAPAVLAGPDDAPVVPVVAEPAPTTVAEVPEVVVTAPEVTAPEVTVPEVTTAPEPTTPEPTTPVVTDPVVTTEPEVTTDPEVSTPAVETTPGTPAVDDTTAAEVTDPSSGDGGLLVALTLGGIGLGTAGRHAVRRGRHRAAQGRR